MIFDNTNSIEPIKEKSPFPFNPLDSLTSRVNGLEKKMVDNETEFTTETLNVDVANIGELNFEGEVKLQNVEDLEIQNDLTVGNDITINGLEDTTPTDTTLALGYNAEGKVIPIKAYQFYDYIVDSQDRFNALMEMSKSTRGVTYKNIAIIGGYGSGTNGEYEYTVDSETTDGKFNGANIDCYKSATINITVDEFTVSEETLVTIFNNVNVVNDLIVLVDGTENENLILHLFSGYSVTTTLNNILIKEPTNSVHFHIYSVNINNSNNFDYVKFDYCHFINTKTVASYINKCWSDSFIPLIKINDFHNIYNEDYVGFSIFDSTISINERIDDYNRDFRKYFVITYVEESKIYVNSDSNSNNINISNVLCKSSDKSTSFIGNNKISLVDTPVGQGIAPSNTYLPYYSKIKRETSYYSYAFVDLGETSKSVLFTDTNPSSITTSSAVYLIRNGKSFGIVKKWKVMNGTTFKYNVYTLSDNTTTYYTDLTFTSIQTISSSWTVTQIAFTPLEIPYLIYCNEVPYYALSKTKFPSSTSCYIDLGESSKTLYYSNNHSVTAYLDVKCTKQIKKWKDTVKGNLVYTLGTNETIYYTDLSFTTLYTTTNTMVETSFNQLGLRNIESYPSSITYIEFYQNTNNCKVEGLGIYEIAYTSNP